MERKHIGMIVPTMDNSFFSSLAVQIEKTMALKGYQTVMVSPSITALDRKTDRLAEKASEILLKMMRGEKDVPVENIIEVNLEQRDSSR